MVRGPGADDGAPLSYRGKLPHFTLAGKTER
jgi:hypothetical protein